MNDDEKPMFDLTFLGLQHGYGWLVTPATNFFQKTIVRRNGEAFLTRKGRVRTAIVSIIAIFVQNEAAIRPQCPIYGERFTTKRRVGVQPVVALGRFWARRSTSARSGADFARALG